MARSIGFPDAKKIMARSSAETEFYATDECVKAVLRIQHLVADTATTSIFLPTKSPITVYNDNNVCVCWSKSTTTKGLRHITIRGNAIRELVQDNTVTITHIVGLHNMADIFTKELRNTTAFLVIRDTITSAPPKPVNTAFSSE